MRGRGRAPLAAFCSATLRPPHPYGEGNGRSSSSHTSGVRTCPEPAARRPLPERGRLKWEAERGPGVGDVRKQAHRGPDAPTGALNVCARKGLELGMGRGWRGAGGRWGFVLAALLRGGFGRVRGAAGEAG